MSDPGGQFFPEQAAGTESGSYLDIFVAIVKNMLSNALKIKKNLLNIIEPFSEISLNIDK
jgi:hypothetical protein